MNTFTRHDAEKLETLTQTVGAFRKKAGLTTLDLMVACRFILANKYEWEECLEAAQDKHEAWIAYYDTGAHEEDAADRKIRALEMEVERLVGVAAELEAENEVMRVSRGVLNGIGHVVTSRSN
jgi:hypothetical protein